MQALSIHTPLQARLFRKTKSVGTRAQYDYVGRILRFEATVPGIKVLVEDGDHRFIVDGTGLFWLATPSPRR